MTRTQVQTIIDKIEGAGTYVEDTPLAFYKISSIVNSFDWSRSSVTYDICRVIFKPNGLYYLLPVKESKQEPVGLTVNVDYDIVGGRYWVYMKPKGTPTYDMLAIRGIGSINFIPSVAGGVI